MTRVTGFTKEPEQLIASEMPEAQLQDCVVQAARTLGWLVCHFRPAVNRRGHWQTPIQGNPGFPDLVLAKAGKVIFAELKKEKSGLAVAQYEWFDALKGHIYLWRPHDWLSGEVIRILKEG